MKKTLLITHDGFCHMDDLLSTVVLQDLYKNNELLRTRSVEVAEDYWADVTFDSFIEYDVTLLSTGELDHHTKDNPVVDGRKLAAIGKIWRAFKCNIMDHYGIDLISWKTIDTNLIMPIDIMDNGGIVNPLNYYINAKMQEFSAQGVDVFWSTLHIVKEIFHDIIRTEIKATASRKEVEALPNYVVNGKCFKLADKFYSVGRELPFCDGIITKDGDIYKVLFVNGNTFTKKGVKANEIEGVIFTHPAGFCGNVNTLEALKEIV